MDRVVIVGGGQGAGQAVASLRQEGYEGEIMILTEEPHLPYQRPPLSKQFLAGTQGAERIYLRPEKFYIDNQIEILTNQRVESLDLERRCVLAQGGQLFTFSQLILATGSRVRRLPDLPGASLEGVVYLRTLDEAERLKSTLTEANHLVVIGGGYIGLEVAAVAVEAGLSVTVLEMMPRILSRVATPGLSAFYQRAHQARGVTIKTESRAVKFIEASNRVNAVILDDGSHLPADVVVVGIGVEPNVELAETAGLTCANGIVVDTHCRTTHPEVYAIGDCTNHPNLFAGKPIRLESVPNAMEQARVVAAMIGGKEKSYDAEPWFWSDQYDIKLQMAGFTEEATQSVVRGDIESGAAITFYLKEERVIGVEAINSVRDFISCRKLVAGRVKPDLTQLTDADIPLKAFLE